MMRVDLIAFLRTFLKRFSAIFDTIDMTSSEHYRMNVDSPNVIRRLLHYELNQANFTLALSRYAFLLWV